MSDIIRIPLDRIVPNPKQVRKTFRRIDELARSIEQYGLLHNLVVHPHAEPGYYEIVAGERRYRALTLLSKQGRLPSTEVSCLVISGDSAFANVVENLVREDVPLWEVGRTYLGFYESGCTQAEIAARIGKSQGHVSTAMILARNLAPAVVVRLAQLPPNTVPIQRLLRITTLVDDEDEPDEEAQSRLFQQMLDLPVRRGRRDQGARSVIPHFRLNTPLTRAWAVNREARHKLARWLAHRFAKTGVAVCTDELSVVAWVNPIAQVKFAVPPFQRIERHQCVNNPSWTDCECRHWFDPESAGPWGKRHSPSHHPLCIFDEKALGRWREYELPEKVRKQVETGGFLADSGSPT